MSIHSTPHRIPPGIMKRSVFGLATLSLVFSLAACTGLPTTGAADSRVSDVDRLAAGTLKLEGTGEAVSADMATQLLPLWQLMAELGNNSATAPQETQAVIQQIRSTMTASQLSAIDEMQLTASDIIQTIEITSSRSSGTSARRSPGQSGGGPGGPIGGPPPEGGGGIDMLVGGGTVGAASGATTTSAQSRTTGGTGREQGSLALIQQVITLLQKKSTG